MVANTIVLVKKSLAQPAVPFTASTAQKDQYEAAVSCGAKYDASTSKQRRIGWTAEGGLFRKGSVNVTLQSPWMNMSTGALMKDTMLSIVQTAQ